MSVAMTRILLPALIYIYTVTITLQEITARRVTQQTFVMRSEMVKAAWFIGFGMNRVYIASHNLNSECNARAHAPKARHGKNYSAYCV